MTLLNINNIFKYIIFLILLYLFLKNIPSTPLSDKDIINLITIICFFVIAIDLIQNGHIFESLDNTNLNLESIKNITQSNTNEQMASLPQIVPAEQKPNYSNFKNDNISCSTEIEKIKSQFNNEINKLKFQLDLQKNISNDSKKIHSLKYYEYLMKELIKKGILNNIDVENIQAKLKSKILSIDEIIISLEKLNTEGKINTPKNYNINNNLPNDFYSPIGDKIANDWDKSYTILDTSKWMVPMPRPPVCINTSPCKVCPSDSSNYPVNLLEWNDSRHVITDNTESTQPTKNIETS